MALTVTFYRTPNGDEPVREWIATLPDLERKSIGSDLRLVERAWPVGMPLVRKMEAGLWELRLRLPGRSVRIFFTVQSDSMVLLHVFLKKSEKTPAQELQLARRRLRIVKGREQ